MARRTLGAIIIVVIGVMAISVFAVTRKDKDTDSSKSTATTSQTPTAQTPSGQSMTNTTPSPSSQTTPQPAGDTVNVSIENMAFTPRSITVKAGTTVRWNNNDSAPHTVTADDGQSNGPNSETLNKDDSYSLVFDTPGTYTYHCSLHAGMTGTVVVTE